MSLMIWKFSGTTSTSQRRWFETRVMLGEGCPPLSFMRVARLQLGGHQILVEKRPGFRKHAKWGQPCWIVLVLLWSVFVFQNLSKYFNENSKVIIMIFVVGTPKLYRLWWFAIPPRLHFGNTYCQPLLWFSSWGDDGNVLGGPQLKSVN